MIKLPGGKITYYSWFFTPGLGTGCPENFFIHVSQQPVLYNWRILNTRNIFLLVTFV